MAKRKPPKRGTARKSNFLMRVVIGMFIVTVLSTVALAGTVFVYLFDLTASRKERAAIAETAEELREDVNAFDAQMRKTNPDYLCWLNIEGSKIDFPVVRGDDNEKYLHLSFAGEKNAYGAVFMDYRCEGDYVPHIIIYAHNAKTGDMFGSLRKFLNADYLAEHSVITLAVNGRAVEYEIFSARKTDTRDPAYYLDFNVPGAFSEFAERCGAPADTAQIITLSTCYSGDDKDERVIVQGALLNTTGNG